MFGMVVKCFATIWFARNIAFAVGESECKDGNCGEVGPAAGRVLLQHKQSVETVKEDLGVGVLEEKLRAFNKLTHKRVARLQRKDVTHPSVAAAWVATSFSDCIDCSTGAVQVREVKCLRIFDGADVSSSLCSEYPEPATSVPCECQVLPCNPNITNLCPASAPPACPAETSLDDDFIELGCFERLTGHDAPGDAASVYDWSCMNHTGSPCKSGLPFYSMRSNAMTGALCFEFCIGKGLDIFGLVEGVECRCGASAVNSHDNGLDISHLQFNPAALTLHLNDMTGCPVRAYRYAGHYEGGGVPYGLTQILDTDSNYVRSIKAGRKIEESEDSPAGYQFSTTTPEVLLQGDEGQAPEGYQRNCWPDNCGPGRGPWQDRQTALPQGVTLRRFQEYVVIPYHFEDGLDNTRKEAFRLAVQRWHAKTCIALVTIHQGWRV